MYHLWNRLCPLSAVVTVVSLFQFIFLLLLTLATPGVILGDFNTAKSFSKVISVFLLTVQIEYVKKVSVIRQKYSTKMKSNPAGNDLEAPQASSWFALKLYQYNLLTGLCKRTTTHTIVIPVLSHVTHLLFFLY